MPFGRAAALSFAALALATARCDNASCVDRNPDVGSLCVPAAVQPDQTSVIQVREACGLCSTQPQCDSTLVDGEVHVELHAQFCNGALHAPVAPGGRLAAGAARQRDAPVAGAQRRGEQLPADLAVTAAAGAAAA